jgi:hypothetical protein
MNLHGSYMAGYSGEEGRQPQGSGEEGIILVPAGVGVTGIILPSFNIREA